MRKLKNSIRLLASAGLALAAIGAQASYLDGQSVTYSYENAGATLSSQTVTVGAGAELGYIYQTGDGLGSIDIADSSITATFIRDGAMDSNAFNGFRLTLPTTLAAFGNASFAGTTPASFTSGAHISFVDHTLSVNWTGVSFLNGDTVVVNFSPVAAVPEPETYALMLAGLGVVGAVSRRQRRVK